MREKERGRETEGNRIHTSCACMRLHRHQRQPTSTRSRLLSIHARRRPIVRRVDNFKTMPTGPAAHCAKITGTPVKREQKRRGRNERGWLAGSFVREKGGRGGRMTARARFYLVIIDGKPTSASQSLLIDRCARISEISR